MTDDEVYLAMRQKGWLIPQTEEEVVRAEKELAASEIHLPDALLSPAEIFAKLNRDEYPAAREVTRG